MYRYREEPLEEGEGDRHITETERFKDTKRDTQKDRQGGKIQKRESKYHKSSIVNLQGFSLL